MNIQNTNAQKNAISNFTLDNGLEIVVIPDHRAKVATHMLWYKVGSADESPKQSGLAHYLEHLMFKGTKNTSPDEFSQFVAEVGGNENAFTSNDFTAYYQRIPPGRLQKTMALESDRMKNLTLSDEDVKTEKLVILEERNVRTDSKPIGLFLEAMNSALFQKHPYGIPIIGWRHEIENLTKQQVLDFYQTYYRPDNAVLIVAGDVKPKEVLAMAKQTYGKIAKGEKPIVRHRRPEPIDVVRENIAMQDVRVKTPIWQRYYLVPSYKNSNDGAALELLGEILGGGATSRLYQKLVVEKQVATYANIFYNGERLDDTIFAISSSPTPNANVENIETLIDEVIKDFIEQGVLETEIKRAQKKLIAAAAFAQDSQQTLAQIYGTALAIDRSIEDVLKWRSDIKNVTKQDVEMAAKKYLTKQRSITGTLTPQ